MLAENHIYQHRGLKLHGYLARQDSQEKKPAVLVVHDWTGRNTFACDKAEMLARMGYIGFAVDMYGEGQLGDTTEEKQALMLPVMNDREELQARMKTALDVVKSIKGVDAHRIAAIGFCFGGLCVLDLARSGADIKGVVSFHGLLNQPENLVSNQIKAKILALSGYDDPMVPPEHVNHFCQEMTRAGADWQVNMYGHTQHAFTNPEAHDSIMGTVYNPQTAQRAFKAMTDFLQETLA